MKKTLFLVAVASLAMASCSKDETTSINRGRGIDFRATLDKGTRATETTTENLTEFWCTAQNGLLSHFSDVQFVLEDGFFTSATDYYWPSDGSELKFYAYAPIKTDFKGDVVINGNTQAINNFQPDEDLSKQVDLITATAAGDKTNSEDTGVHLNFNHALAQIGIQAKNTGENIVKVQQVAIREVVGVGNYAFKTHAWAPSGSTSSKTSYYGAELANVVTLSETAVDLMGNGGNAMLIPQQLVGWTPESDKTNAEQGAWLAIKINLSKETEVDGNKKVKVLYPRNGSADADNDGIADKDGGVAYAWVGVPIDTKWEAGKKYIYTLDFSNGAGYIDPEDPENPGELGDTEPIKFNVTVTEWAEADAKDTDITFEK